MNKFIQGSVWWFKKDSTESGITHGTHPCVVISATNWNETSGSLIVVPATSDPCNGTLKTPKLELSDSVGYFFPTQITTVPKKSLFTFEGVMSAADFNLLRASISSLLCSESADLNLFNLKDPRPGSSEPSISVTPVADACLVTRQRRQWTHESKTEFLNDCNKLPEQDVANKWDLGSIYTVRKYRKVFSANRGDDAYDRGQISGRVRK